MLALLPQLLFLTPVAITLIRLAVAYALLLSAAQYIAGTNGSAVRVIGVVAGILGLLIALGAFTQAAAIAATLVLVTAKTKLYIRSPLSEDAQWFVLVMSVVLIATGAGAFAFDLPL